MAGWKEFFKGSKKKAEKGMSVEETAKRIRSLSDIISLMKSLTPEQRLQAIEGMKEISPKLAKEKDEKRERLIRKG